jgi:hypothetical protein
MTLPKRIRLLKVLHSHLYDRVKNTLATDKEIRHLQSINEALKHKYELLAKPRKNNSGKEISVNG